MTSSWITVGACATALSLAVLVAPAREGSDRRFERRAGEESIALQMAYSLELLALALAGGAPVAGALAAVAEASGSAHVRAVLRRVCAGLQWGLDDAQAWASAPAQWRPVASAFALAGRAGAAPAELLRRTAQDIRAAESERITIAGAKAGVRIVLPLGLCSLPAFLLITVVPLVMGLIDLG